MLQRPCYQDLTKTSSSRTVARSDGDVITSPMSAQSLFVGKIKMSTRFNYVSSN
ncbi:hypothetical protein BDV93DRAFT_519089, partial [Ceratobasidium sp. AG-I]